MRASWSGFFRLGQVMIPMRLFPATRETTPRFVQLHKNDHSPIRRVNVCALDGKPLKPDDIVRAVEHEGKMVELSDSEVSTTLASEKSIVVRQFTEPDMIHPLYYDKPYYMVADTGGELAYTILRQAFNRTNKIAVATFALYGREHLATICALDGMLILHRLRFADEIVPKTDIPTPALPQPAPSQIKAATELMEHYSTEFYISDYKNNQVETLNELIERKSKGLPMKRKKRASLATTPEDELLPAMRRLLASTAAELDSE